MARWFIHHSPLIIYHLPLEGKWANRQGVHILRFMQLLRRHWHIVFVIVVVFLLGMSNLIYPFGKDQGEYAYIGSAWLRGEAIYKDVFNVKPPLTHIVHGISQVLFGFVSPQGQADMLNIRIFDHLWQTATALVVMQLGTRLYRSRWVGMFAATIYATTYYAVDFWHSAQTDGWINLPLTLSALLLIDKHMMHSRRTQLLLCGGLIGIAVLFKYPIGIILPLYGLVLLFTEDKKSVLWLGIGFGIPLLLIGIGLASKQALDEFLHIQFTYIPDYNARFLPPDLNYLQFTWRNVVAEWQRSPRFQFFIVLLVGEGLLYCSDKGSSHVQYVTYSIVLLLGIAALVHYVLQNKFYAYHALPLLLPQALIIAHLFQQIHQLFASRLPQVRMAVVGVAILLPFVLIFGDEDLHGHRDPLYAHQTLWAIVTGERSLEAYYREPRFWTHNGIFESSANLSSAEFLTQNTSSEDEIFIWAFEPAIYYLAERKSVSRYIYNFPLYGEFAWEPFKVHLMQELETKPPAFILIAQQDAQPWVTGTQEDSMQALMRFDQLRDFVFGRYEDVNTIGHFKIFQRKP